MNTIKKEYEAPQATAIELKCGLIILVQFSASGDFEDISEGDSDW